MPRPARAAALGAAAVLLVGSAASCAFSGAAPRDRYYRFEIPEPQKRFEEPKLRGKLSVAPLRASGLVGATPLVYRDPKEPGEIFRYGYHHWIESPTLMMQSELIRFLRGAGVAEAVVSTAVSTKADYHLLGRIRHLEQVVGGEGGSYVVVEVELNLTEGSDRELLFHGSYREERPAPGDVQDAAAEMSRAVGAVLERFLAELSEASELDT